MSFPKFEETRPESGFQGSPFPISDSKELYTRYRNNPKVQKQLALYNELLADGKGNIHRSKNRFSYIDKDGDKEYNKDKDVFKYFITIFSSTQESKLREIFKSIEPTDDEIIVLLENNSTDILSSRKTFILIGANVRLKLKNNSNYINATPFLSSIESIYKDSGINKKKLGELINSSTGEYDDSYITESLISGIHSVVTIPEKITAIGTRLISDFLKDVVDSIDKLKVPEKKWNPDKSPNEKFTPFFFPSLKLDSNREIKLPQSISILINDSIDSIIGQQNALLTESGVNEHVKLKLAGVHADLGTNAFDFAKVVLKEVIVYVGELSNYSAEQLIIFINAVIAGLLDSIMGFIGFVVAVIRIPFTVSATGNELLSDLEKLDEFIQNVISFDFASFFKTIGTFFSDVLKKIKELSFSDLITKVFNANLAQAGYFIGAVIEFVLEIIVEALLTGGTLAVVSIVRKVGANAAKLAKAIQASVNKAFRLTGEITQDFGQMLLRLIAKGPGELKALFDDIYAAIATWVDELAGASRKDIINAVKKGRQKLDEFADGTKRKLTDYTRKGNFGEMVVDEIFLTKKIYLDGVVMKLKRVSTNIVKTLDDKGSKGIDGVYENILYNPPPPQLKYIITEVKYGGAVINKTKTKSGGAQMSEKWVKWYLRRGAVDANLGAEILIHGYEPLLCNVSAKGNLTVKTILQTPKTADIKSIWNGRF